MDAAVAMGPEDEMVRAELFELLLATDGIEEFLNELVALAARTVDNNMSASITARKEDRTVTAAASDDFATSLDEHQYTESAGPCLQAMETGRQVEITDLAAAHNKWGLYGSYALARGLSACLCTPMTAAGQTWGALNLYSKAPESFTDADRLRAENLAGQAAAAFAIAARLAAKTELSEQLRTALESRSVIDQALGIIMGAQHCDAPAAFAILRAASQDRNIKLRDIAVRIVDSTARGARPSAPPSGGSDT